MNTRPERGDPKPDNFEEMAAAWNDPIRFGIEVAKYKAQLADYWATHHHQRERPDDGAEVPF